MTNISEFGVKVLLLTLVVSLLPSSPFNNFSYLVSNLPYLSYLNWFLPISETLVVFEAWLVVVSIYYSILFILNYVGIIKS